jgi:hypothetical protein
MNILVFLFVYRRMESMLHMEVKRFMEALCTTAAARRRKRRCQSTFSQKSSI